MGKPYECYESGDYLCKNPSWDEEDSEWKASQVLDLIRSNKLNPISIVDVGCGAGGILAAIRKQLPDVNLSGFDIAPDVSKFWEKHSCKKINFTVGNFLKINTNKYDVLLLLDVFEHVPDPFSFLSSLHGHANYSIFHIPLDLSAMSVARESPLLYVRKKVGHIHYYTKNIALLLLEECGYEVMDWKYTGAAFTVPQKSWKSYIASLPRRVLFTINRDFGVRLLGGDTLIVLAKSS